MRKSIIWFAGILTVFAIIVLLNFFAEARHLIAKNCDIVHSNILLEIPSKVSYLKLADIIESHGDPMFLNLVTETTDSMDMEYDFVKKKLVSKGSASESWSLSQVTRQSGNFAKEICKWAKNKFEKQGNI